MIHLGTVMLETERLILRPFKISDAAAMYANWASDPQVTKFLTWQPHESAEATAELLSQWVPQYAQPDYYNWAIALKDDPEQVIGGISVPEQNPRAESVTIGYCLGRKWWGKGIMPEAFKAVIRFFFETEGAGRVQAFHDIQNPNSGKVMEKCGLRKEGTLRRYGWNTQGICDECIWAIVAEDYFAAAGKAGDKERAGR